VNTVSVETSTLYPGGVVAERVVERDEAGRLVHIVAVDYQLPGRDLRDVAASYAGLHGVQLRQVTA
jgi:hypothetical protein